MELTPKQEKFAQLYVELGNASEAYRQAYNSKAKPATLYPKASKLLAQDNISTRVQEIREELRATHGITLSDLLRELEEARKIALDVPTPSAAVAATMGKAKLLGLDRAAEEKGGDDAATALIKLIDKLPS